MKNLKKLGQESPVTLPGREIEEGRLVQIFKQELQETKNLVVGLRFALDQKRRWSERWKKLAFKLRGEHAHVVVDLVDAHSDFEKSLEDIERIIFKQGKVRCSETGEVVELAIEGEDAVLNLLTTLREAQNAADKRVEALEHQFRQKKEQRQLKFKSGHPPRHLTVVKPDK